MDRITDLQLLEGFARGEPERVEAFTKRFYPKVRSLVFKMGFSQDQSKDITQEVFIILFEKYKSFRSESSLQTWIMKITYNLCLSQLNNKGRFFYGLEESHSSITDSIDSWELREEQWEVLESALKLLSPTDQIYIELFYTNGCSIKEMAQILGKTESAVKTGLSRVRGRLHELVNINYGEN